MDEVKRQGADAVDARRRLFLAGPCGARDEASSFVEVPADTPVSAIAPYVEQATRDLFVLFRGLYVPDTKPSAMG